MKYNIVTLLTVLSIFLNTSLHAENKEDLLQTLDDMIEEKAVFREKRLEAIKSLMEQIDNLDKKESKTQLIDTYYQIYQNYSHFQTDSALHYLDILIATDEIKEDLNNSTKIQLDRAEMLAIMGVYTDAVNIIEHLDTKSMNTSNLTRYYHVCRTIYGWMSDYMRHMPDMEAKLLEKTAHYRDSIIEIERDELSKQIVIADRYLYRGQLDSTLSVLNQYKDTEDKNQLPYIYYIYSEVYKHTNNPEEQLNYLARTAIEDIKRGVTEYTALPSLASLLFEKGDIERAYTYMFCSLEDANYCNARLRSFEISEVYPFIERSYKQNVKERQKVLHFIVSAIAFIALLLMAGMFILRKQNRKLSFTRTQLADANDQLEKANSQLANTNADLQLANKELKQMDKLKEDYIAIYLKRCREYLEEVEHYRRSALRLAKNRQQEELMKFLNDDTMFNDEQQRFYKDFDEAFLNLYPNFVENFNALLLPENRINPKKNEKLSTEMRIFALIRLGVNDTAQIAHFLNYSIPTIYNYRSRIRNKSIYSKENFEEKLMQL